MTNRKSMMKRSVWIGALFAPLTAPVLYVMFVMLFVPDITPKHERTLGTALVALTFGFIPASYFVSFVFGAPLIYILRRFKKLSFFWVVLLAVPLGAIALSCLLIIVMAFGAEIHWAGVGWGAVFSFLSTGALLGVVTAAGFCLMTGITRRLR
jgi:hypothetical protein